MIDHWVWLSKKGAFKADQTLRFDVYQCLCLWCLLMLMFIKKTFLSLSPLLSEKYDCFCFIKFGLIRFRQIWTKAKFSFLSQRKYISPSEVKEEGVLLYNKNLKKLSKKGKKNTRESCPIKILTLGAIKEDVSPSNNVSLEKFSKIGRYGKVRPRQRPLWPILCNNEH